MSAGAPTSRDGMRPVYWILIAVLVLLAILGLITYSGNSESREAQAKAEELTQALEEVGLRVPEDQDVFVRSFGTDGGAVCDNPASALGRAALYDLFANGASQVGRRPVIVDRRLIQGGALILQTYCPERLQEYRDKFDDLKFDDVIKD